MTSISDYTFARCYSLTDVTIPDGVTSIGEAAFTGCRSLTAITLPESVTSIGQEALYNECASLTAVIILNPDCEIYDDAKTINEVSAIRGHNGSSAQTYAEKYGRTFERLDAEQPTENTLGDLNNDTSINASDAALVLIAAAKLGATGESGLTAAQEAAADVNGDKLINASDAAIILQYAATVGAGSTDTLAEFLEKRKQ